MLHQSRVEQMYNQPIHLSHELKLCIEITKILACAKFWACDTPIRFIYTLLPVPTYTILAIFMIPWVIGPLGPFKWPAFWGTILLRRPGSCPEHRQDFPRAWMPLMSFPFICCAYILSSKHYSGPLLLIFCVQMGACVSYTAWGAD